MKTILWLSRHPMGDDQLKDLEKLLECKVKEITKNITWTATEDQLIDSHANITILLDLITKEFKEAYKYDNNIFIAGVFPPVVFEALSISQNWIPEGKRIHLLSPVSKQDKTIREDGEAIIKFVHLRWTHVGLYEN